MRWRQATIAVLLGLGLLAVGGLSDVIDVTEDASAVCSRPYHRLTGDCNPCETAGHVVGDAWEKVTGQPWTCVH